MAYKDAVHVRIHLSLSRNLLYTEMFVYKNVFIKIAIC